MKHKILIIAFAAQFALIALAFLNGYLPLLLGEQVKVRAKGYDPRDLLAGNFVRLDYGVSVEESEFNATQKRKNFFVLLVDENKDGVFEFGDIVLDEPQNALYVKAKRIYEWNNILAIGAEKYFAPKEKALEIERKLNALPSDASKRDISEATLANGDNAKSEDGSVDADTFVYENENFNALVTLKIYKGKARIVNLEIVDLEFDKTKQGFEIN